MAGNYPDAPSWRMAIDRDGTQGFKITSTNVITQLTATQMQALNDEGDANPVAFEFGDRITLIFPELRDIDGFFVDGDADIIYGFNYKVEVSPNTTNGVDGTWTQIGTGGGTDVTDGVSPAYRSVTSVTTLAQRAIRVRNSDTSPLNNGTIAALHVYGEPAPGENPDRLALWHPTLDERVPPAYFDWGNTPRSSSGDRLFRVKNLSSTLTAVSVRVAMEALTDGSPSVPGQHSLSYGGGSFLAQVNVGNLAPGAISGPVTLRRITPSNAQLGLWAFRVFAEANSWS